MSAHTCPTCGRPGRPAAETVRLVEQMAAMPPLEVCRQLGARPSAVARALYRAERPDLARPFAVVAHRLLKAGDPR